MFSNAEWMQQSFSDDEYQRTDEEVIQYTIDDLIDEQRMEQIEPVFNRDGFYYDRLNNSAWHEWKGTAWKGDVEDFKYRLGQCNARILEPDEVEAIKALIVYGSCPFELKLLLWEHKHQVANRNMRRDWRKD